MDTNAGNTDSQESDADVVLRFTRGQVNAWAGYQLTDDQLARLENVLPDSTFPETVGLITENWLNEDHGDGCDCPECFRRVNGFYPDEAEDEDYDTSSLAKEDARNAWQHR